jgi:hypothetical protein
MARRVSSWLARLVLLQATTKTVNVSWSWPVELVHVLSNDDERFAHEMSNRSGGMSSTSRREAGAHCVSEVAENGSRLSPNPSMQHLPIKSNLLAFYDNFNFLLIYLRVTSSVTTKNYSDKVSSCSSSKFRKAASVVTRASWEVVNVTAGELESANLVRKSSKDVRNANWASSGAKTRNNELNQQLKRSNWIVSFNFLKNRKTQKQLGGSWRLHRANKFCGEQKAKSRQNWFWS